MIVFFCWVAAMLLAAAILHASDEHVYANIVLSLTAFFVGISCVVALLNFWQGV